MTPATFKQRSFIAHLLEKKDWPDIFGSVGQVANRVNSDGTFSYELRPNATSVQASRLIKDLLEFKDK